MGRFYGEADKILDRSSITYVDASHNLQDFRPDANCGLFTFNILQAIGQLLEDPTVAQTVYASALESNEGVPAEKEQAEETLKGIFQENLKAYLPFYYNPDGSRKSKETLKEHHLKQRWDMGSQAGKSLEYMTGKGFIPQESGSHASSSSS